jgi:hypothetical protein
LRDVSPNIAPVASEGTQEVVHIPRNFAGTQEDSLDVSIPRDLFQFPEHGSQLDSLVYIGTTDHTTLSVGSEVEVEPLLSGKGQVILERMRNPSRS